MAKLIKYDGTEAEVQPQDPKKGFSMEEVYSLLDCRTIQLIRLGLKDYMLMDEDAKMKKGFKEKINYQATALLHLAGGSPNDFIVGDVLICNNKEWK